MTNLADHQKKVMKAFKEEFGIHFSESELQFAEDFLSSALAEQMELVKEEIKIVRRKYKGDGLIGIRPDMYELCCDDILDLLTYR